MKQYYLSLFLFACGGDKILPPVQTPEDTAILFDGDGDGVPDAEDACPEDSNQWTDLDSDGYCDEQDDACPEDPNQFSDMDGDGHCDEVADDCPDDPNQWVDSDEDGICDDDDCAPLDPINTDTDGDGVCDEQDACPEVAGGDADGDGHCDEMDDCPNAQGHVDSNGDGLCDENDDNDGDGLSNQAESAYGEDCRISSPDIADTDGDGITDPADPFPRDPWPEFILFGNDSGTIDFMLSNRDGTFQSAIEIGDAFGGSANTDYRYRFFAISDFNNNGQMDFIAAADPDPTTSGNDLEYWWFWREKADEFQQRSLGMWPEAVLKTIADINNDEHVDVIKASIDKPNYIASVTMHSYLNQGKIHSANCFATVDVANPNGCAFVKVDAVDLTDWTQGQWVFRQSLDAVDVDGDGQRDLAILKLASGGNAATPIGILHGNGDGTFDPPPPNPLFTHNSGTCGSSPGNSIVFGDFNQDDVGDVVVGWDDDGDSGSSMYYPGDNSMGFYTVDTANCTSAIDLNPAHGTSDSGVSASARSFDFNFDGKLDVMLGFQYTQSWGGPSKAMLFLGDGTGNFDGGSVVRTFPNNIGNYFAIPQPLCARFPY